MSTERSFRFQSIASMIISFGLIGACGAQTSKPPAPADNIGHDRHTHHHNAKHPTDQPTAARFVTNRPSSVVLPLPQEKDAFSFVVFGDRTGGPVDGVKVLADAVRDANLIEPDMVLTVGDLINGYNDTPAWMEQMKEFKQIMGELRCPWFPVAGNHDTYWRDRGNGEKKPVNEHDDNYEMHFGPLWYAFEHKNSWFIAIYSDETNPANGTKNFNKPENHVMSDAQFNWLGETLKKAKDADHVFLFLHHPRWTGGQYGEHWDKVHKLLVEAKNVTAVFAGHIHRMRYDPKDGIEYVTLATVGGHQEGKVPEAGWLHHFNVVTVRKQQVAMAAIPVGKVINVREITNEMTQQCSAQADQTISFDRKLAFAMDGGVDLELRGTLKNVTSRPIDITVAPDSGDSRWSFSPDHDHARIEPGESRTLAFRAIRKPGAIDDTFRTIEMVVNTDVLMPTHRYSLPESRMAPQIDEATIPAMSVPAQEHVLHLDGDDAMVVANDDISLPDGPFTLEAWIKPESFGDRTGLLCKTESSDYGMFISKGVPEFSVFLGDKYVAAKAPSAVPTGTWTHVAGVFDGSEVRLYVNGKKVAMRSGSGVRKTNTLPLAIGSDIGRGARTNSYFTGEMDAVRLTKRAVYAGESFEPARRLAPDSDTVLLTNMDTFLGNALWGEGPRKLIGSRVGDPVVRVGK